MPYFVPLGNRRSSTLSGPVPGEINFEYKDIEPTVGDKMPEAASLKCLYLGGSRARLPPFSARVRVCSASLSWVSRILESMHKSCRNLSLFTHGVLLRGQHQIPGTSRCLLVTPWGKLAETSLVLALPLDTGFLCAHLCLDPESRASSHCTHFLVQVTSQMVVRHVGKFMD